MFPRDRSGEINTGDDVDEELTCFGDKGTGDGDAEGDFGPYAASEPSLGKLDSVLLTALA